MLNSIFKKHHRILVVAVLTVIQLMAMVVFAQSPSGTGLNTTSEVIQLSEPFEFPNHFCFFQPNVTSDAHTVTGLFGFMEFIFIRTNSSLATLQQNDTLEHNSKDEECRYFVYDTRHDQFFPSSINCSHMIGHNTFSKMIGKEIVIDSHGHGPLTRIYGYGLRRPNLLIFRDYVIERDTSGSSEDYHSKPVVNYRDQSKPVVLRANCTLIGVITLNDTKNISSGFTEMNKNPFDTRIALVKDNSGLVGKTITFGFISELVQSNYFSNVLLVKSFERNQSSDKWISDIVATYYDEDKAEVLILDEEDYVHIVPIRLILETYVKCACNMIYWELLMDNQDEQMYIVKKSIKEHFQCHEQTIRRLMKIQEKGQHSQILFIEKKFSYFVTEIAILMMILFVFMLILAVFAIFIRCTDETNIPPKLGMDSGHRGNVPQPLPPPPPPSQSFGQPPLFAQSQTTRNFTKMNIANNPDPMAS